MKSKPLMIGDLARRTATKINTIRFYEEIGLLPRPHRTESGRRTYELADVSRLSFIRSGRSLGFSLDEIRSLIALSHEQDQDCSSVRDLAARHLVDVEARLERLEQLREELHRLATSCDGGPTSECRIIEAIGGTPVP